MDLVIPTYSRYSGSLQTTLGQLVAAGYTPTLVVRPEQSEAYWKAYGNVARIHTATRTLRGIADTRDYIIHDMPGDRYVCMFDDDLHFAVRRLDDPTKFRQPEVPDIVRMVQAIEGQLKDGYPHVGLGAREGGNRNTDDLMWNTRMMRVLAYDREVLKRYCLTFHPMEVMEDFHMTLQLLRLGYDLPLLNNWVSNQAGGSQGRGGCSEWRTMELHSANAKRLAQLHPGFVKVVQKVTKTAWGGGTRDDVMVQWKQARKAGTR